MAEKNLKNLVLLHSNDLHGDFTEENIDNNLVGGVSRLSGYVSKVRSEEENSLYVIAGDMFRGSVIDSEYKGVSTIEVMNLLMPDVVSIGNHEIDYGIAHLLFIEKCARFPIINANLYIKTNHMRLFRSHYIMEVGGMHILFIGIITEEILAQAKQDEVIGSFVDVNEAAMEVGRICNSYKSIDIDLTILLTHIGFEEDKILASKLDPQWGVDIIVGGHTHTVLERPEIVNGIYVVQAGVGTDQIGRFDLVVDTDTNSVHSADWTLVPIDSKHCPVDTDVEKLISFYKDRTDKKYGRVITRFDHVLTHPDRTHETELGNLFADILQKAFGADVMLLGSGSIRKEALGPIVTYTDLLEIYPYDDSCHMITVTGEQLKNMMLYVMRDNNLSGHSEFYQVSDSLHMEYDCKSHSFLRFDIFGKPYEPDHLYKVTIQKYHFMNLEEFFNISREEVEKNAPVRVVSTSCRDILEEYMENTQRLASHVGGRIVFIGRD